DIDMIKKYDGYVQINAGENIKKLTNKYFNLISDIIEVNL
ncbi:hydrolase, partial [Brachyspira pilosicoli]|nr:hydrolase [Brachyspira pilosicoli]